MADITALPLNFVKDLGQIGIWLQALGVVIILTVIFDVIAFLLNRKRLKEITVIKKDMARIESKINEIARRQKK